MKRAALGLCVGLVLLSPAAWAAEAGMERSREEIIERALDCFSRNAGESVRLDWRTVCATSVADREEATEEKPKQQRFLLAKNKSLAVGIDEEGNVTFDEHPVAADVSSGPVKAGEPSWEGMANQSADAADEEVESYLADISSESLNIDPMGFSLPETETLQLNLTGMAGFREDNFNWTIAGDITGNNPNILSELTWQDVRMWQYKVAGEVVYRGKWVLDGWGAYSMIYDGQNQDSDFLGNNRTSEFSRSRAETEDDDAVDLSAGVGYRFEFPQGKRFFNRVDDLWVTVLGGYSYHELNLVDTKAVQEIPPTGAFEFQGINKVYEAEWQGPWVGFEIEGQANKFVGSFRFEYHDVEYSAEANWPLRSDFAHPLSFIHEADGYGLVFNFGLDYLLTDDLTLNFRGDVQDWSTDSGLDRTFFANGTSSDTRLNEVNWESFAIMVGATYHFGI